MQGKGRGKIGRGERREVKRRGRKFGGREKRRERLTGVTDTPWGVIRGREVVRAPPSYLLCGDRSVNTLRAENRKIAIGRGVGPRAADG